MKLHVNLFVGHHKTGSTSIQRHLAIHNQELIGQGFLYPFVDLVSILCGRCAFRDAALDLPAMGLQARINTFASKKNFLEPHNGLAFTMLHEFCGAEVPVWHKGLPASSEVMFTLIREQLDDSGAESLLIASEALANFGGVGNGLVQRLLHGLPTGQRKLMAILRRPDDYLHSWYVQELCFGYPRMGTLSERFSNLYMDSIHVDYRLMLSAWIENDAFAQLDLCDYRELLTNGGSVPWFLEAAGVGAATLEGHDDTRANPSLHPAFVNLVRRSNTHLPHKQAMDLISLLKTLGLNHGLPPATDVELLGAAARRLLCRRFEPINGYLGNLVNRQLFFPDTELMQRERPFPLHAVEPDAARLASELLSPQLTPIQLKLVESWGAALGVTKLR